MKRKIIFLILSLCLLFSLAASCSRRTELPNYAPVGSLPEEYSQTDAAADQCVVFDDNILISGSNMWNAFLSLTEREKAANVRICFFRSERLIWLYDLSYDGEQYTVQERGKTAEQYPCLNHSRFPNSVGDVLNIYFLAEGPEITYDDLERWEIGASKTPIRAQRVYFEVIPLK